jgi:hypothetical protein
MVTQTPSRTPSILKETFSLSNPCPIQMSRRNHPWPKENPSLNSFLCKTPTNKVTPFIPETGFSKRPLNPKKKKSTNFKNLFFIFLIFFYYVYEGFIR